MVEGDISAYRAFLQWLERERIGDLAGLAGIAISIVGFAFTVVGVRKTKSAADAAKRAAQETKASIRLLETVIEFSEAIAALEELKRLHREANLPILPDRYAHIRKLLSGLRTGTVELTNAQKRIVTQALTNLRTMEEVVDRHLRNKSTINTSRFNRLITDDLDGMIAVLVELKATKVGTSL